MAKTKDKWWTCTFCWKHWKGPSSSECPRGCKPFKKKEGQLKKEEYHVTFWLEVLVGPKMNDTRRETLVECLIEASGQDKAEAWAERRMQFFVDDRPDTGEPVTEDAIGFSVVPLTDHLHELRRISKTIKTSSKKVSA